LGSSPLFTPSYGVFGFQTLFAMQKIFQALDRLVRTFSISPLFGPYSYCSSSFFLCLANFFLHQTVLTSGWILLESGSNSNRFFLHPKPFLPPLHSFFFSTGFPPYIGLVLRAVLLLIFLLSGLTRHVGPSSICVFKFFLFPPLFDFLRFVSTLIAPPPTSCWQDGSVEVVEAVFRVFFGFWSLWHIVVVMFGDR